MFFVIPFSFCNFLTLKHFNVEFFNIWVVCSIVYILKKLNYVSRRRYTTSYVQRQKGFHENPRPAYTVILTKVGSKHEYFWLIIDLRVCITVRIPRHTVNVCSGLAGIVERPEERRLGRACQLPKRHMSTCKSIKSNKIDFAYYSRS